MTTSTGGKMSPFRVAVFMVLLAALISICYVVSGQLFKFGAMVVTAFATSDQPATGVSAAIPTADMMTRLVPVYNAWP